MDDLSQRLSLPKWWIELVIIEYFECRHFFVHDKPWSIDFALLSKEDANTLPSLKVVIPACSILYHNIHPSDLQLRFAKAVTGEPSEPLKRKDIKVEGLANKYCYPMTFNSYQSWDPKLSFGSYCIVLDNNRFYQWKIAELKDVKGSHRGQWHSNFLDLKDIDSTVDKLFSLGKELKKKLIDEIEARRRAKYLYRELERKREPIRSAVIDFHKAQLSSSISNSSMVSLNQNIEDSAADTYNPEFGMPHSSRELIVSIKKAFDYYSDVESYPLKYDEYCKRVEIIEKSEDSVVTRQFWNISINQDIDHVVLTVKYKFKPPDEIHYEIIDGYEKAIGIRNGVFLREEKERVFVDYNNVFLDIVCFPPHRIRFGNYFSKDYHDKINYFTIKDCIHLEGKPMEPFKVGQLCTRCKKGHLELSPKKEIYEKDNFRRRTKVWICDACGQEFKMFSVDTTDEIHFGS